MKNSLPKVILKHKKDAPLRRAHRWVFSGAIYRIGLQEAYAVRKLLGLTNNSETNAYRLVHAEGDGLPGLILDYYNGVIVLQAHSLGMYKAADDIVAALKIVYGDKLRGIYNKSAETLPAEYAKTMSNGYPEQNLSIQLTFPRKQWTYPPKIQACSNTKPININY